VKNCRIIIDALFVLFFHMRATELSKQSRIKLKAATEMKFAIAIILTTAANILQINTTFIPIANFCLILNRHLNACF